MTHSVVSLGCEAGGPEAADVCKLKIPLDRALSRHVTASHCAAVDQFALVIRVDGSLATYGAEGIARLRFQAVRRFVTADIQVPRSRWQSLGQSELRAYLAQQVQLALAACVTRLKKGKHNVDEQRFSAEVGAACAEYIGASNG